MPDDRFLPRERRWVQSKVRDEDLRWVLLGLASAALIFMLYLVISPAFATQGVPTTATVDSVDPNTACKRDCTTYHYTVDAQTYHGSDNKAAGPATVGEQIKLLYDPHDPNTSWIDRRDDTRTSVAKYNGRPFLIVIVAIALCVLTGLTIASFRPRRV
jgi:hypothetical protein